MARSPHDPRTIYYGGNRLFRTRDGGESWDVISPDLTRNSKWKEIPIMGMRRDSTTLSRDDGTSDYGTLTTIAESPGERRHDPHGQRRRRREPNDGWRAHLDQHHVAIQAAGAALGEPRALVGAMTRERRSSPSTGTTTTTWRRTCSARPMAGRRGRRSSATCRPATR